MSKSSLERCIFFYLHVWIYPISCKSFQYKPLHIFLAWYLHVEIVGKFCIPRSTGTCKMVMVSSSLTQLGLSLNECWPWSILTVPWQLPWLVADLIQACTKMLWWSASTRNPRSSSLSPLDIRTAATSNWRVFGTNVSKSTMIPIINCKIFSFGIRVNPVDLFYRKTQHRETFHEQKVTTFYKEQSVFVSGMMFLGIFPCRSWVKWRSVVAEFKLFIFSFAKMLISHVGTQQMKVVIAQHAKIKYFGGGR